MRDMLIERLFDIFEEYGFGDERSSMCDSWRFRSCGIYILTSTGAYQENQISNKVLNKLNLRELILKYADQMSDKQLIDLFERVVRCLNRQG